MHNVGRIILFSTLLMAFTRLSYAQDFSVTITATSGSSHTDLNFGMSCAATDGVDPFPIDVAHPPAPPGGFYAALVWQTVDYLTQTIASTTSERVWGMALHFDGTSPITLTWNNSGLAALGSFVIEDANGGSTLSVDMTTQNSVMVASTFTTLKVIVNANSANNGGGGAGGGCAPGTGGGSASGGAGGTGGVNATGGAGGSGGVAGVGGAGAAVGSGGTSSNNSGGSSATAGSGSGGSDGAGSEPSSSGCSCGLGPSPTSPPSFAPWLLAAALCSLRRRKRPY